MAEDNSFAGQGSVVLDIGEDIGALLVVMPARLEGEEVGIRPGAADGDLEAPSKDGPHHHRHGHEHGHQHGDESHADEWPHVGVVARRAPAGVVHSAVFPALEQGRWQLYLRPDGPVELEVLVVGGHVSEAVWPG